jgi:hypothetical protein
MKTGGAPKAQRHSVKEEKSCGSGFQPRFFASLRGKMPLPQRRVGGIIDVLSRQSRPYETVVLAL